MPTPRARATRTALLAVLFLVGTALVIGVVLAEGERRDARQGQRLVTSQRAGCERTRADREDFAGFIDEAVKVRRAQGDYTVAARYEARAASIRSRIVDCAEAFPLP